MRSSRFKVLALAAAGLCSCSPQAPTVRNALLITLDTTRFDALGSNGAPAGTTPNLDRLASEGVSYQWCRTVAPLTLPAHASMLTGLYPPRHGIRDNGWAALPASASTLAERAHSRGVDTGAIVAAAVLDGHFGLSQGFDHYDQPARDSNKTSSRYEERRADVAVARALEWFRARDSSRPFFLWVHLFDPHAPYEPPAADLARGGGDPYLGEVSFADAAIGRLLEELRSEGALEETLVLVVADHGEAHGEHGDPSHGSFCYEGTMRVPMIIRYPGGHRAGERSDEITSVADVFPTVVEGLGLGAPGNVDGISLFRRRVPEDRGVYFETYYNFLNYGWSPIAGYADRAGKYVHGPRPELYDPRSDPAEATNLWTEDRARPYRSALSRVAARPALERDEGTHLDPGLVIAIKSLGYAAAADPEAELPGPLDDTGRPDARDRAGELADLRRATALGDAGDFASAVPVMREVLSTNPENVYALELLGFYLGELGRYGEQVEVLEERLRLGSGRVETHLNLVRALREVGRDDDALAHFARALEIDPEHPMVRAGLVQFLMQTRRRHPGSRGPGN